MDQNSRPTSLHHLSDCFWSTGLPS